MGVIRSLPENQVNTNSAKHQGYYYVTASVCGWQFYMEDFQIQINDAIKLFAIVDGHNGPEVAHFCSKKIPELFRKNQLIKMHQTQSGIETMLYQLQQLISGSHQQLNQIRGIYNLPPLSKDEVTRSGCSIVLTAITDEQIIISNIGMCKCYATYKKDKSKAILFSGNHITSNKDQQARILKNNGFIYDGRVNGMYPFTRSIGDLHLKQSKEGKKRVNKISYDGLLTSQPSFFCLRKQDISSLLLGSTGFWQKNERVSETISQLGRSDQVDKQKLQELISGMVTSDPTEEKLGLQNMSVTYINFN